MRFLFPPTNKTRKPVFLLLSVPVIYPWACPLISAEKPYMHSPALIWPDWLLWFTFTYTANTSVLFLWVIFDLAMLHLHTAVSHFYPCSYYCFSFQTWQNGKTNHPPKCHPLGHQLGNWWHWKHVSSFQSSSWKDNFILWVCMAIVQATPSCLWTRYVNTGRCCVRNLRCEVK